jgi:hypothetical protein
MTTAQRGRNIKLSSLLKKINPSSFSSPSIIFFFNTPCVLQENIFFFASIIVSHGESSFQAIIFSFTGAALSLGQDIPLDRLFTQN